MGDSEFYRYSCGCIVYRIDKYFKQEDSKILFLSVYQKRWKKFSYHWVSPKGTNEEGEDSKTTAIRETEEEVGIKSINYKGFLGNQNFVQDFGSWKIDWHLVECLKPEELKLQKEEGFISAKWVNIDTARNLFTYKDFIPFLDRAYSIINNSS